MKNIRKLLLELYWSFAPNNYSPGEPRAFPGVTMNGPDVISITVLQSYHFLNTRIPLRPVLGRLRPVAASGLCRLI